MPISCLLKTEDSSVKCFPDSNVNLVPKQFHCLLSFHMGLSENRLVPLHPMVLLIIIRILNGYNWRYTPFSDIPTLSFFLRC